ncbi:hypothetical protein ACOMHN_015585 [Nucella lapillus]
MKCALAVLVMCLHVTAVFTLSSNTCNRGCTCSEGGDGDRWSTKEERLASAVGALAPLAAGGAGLALYKVLKTVGSSASKAAQGAPGDMMPASPRLTNKRGSWDPSDKDSPPSYRYSGRQGSLMGEDDAISFDESFRSPRGSRDTASRWM